MNAHLMPNLSRTIEFLRDAARAPSTEWPSFVKALPSIPKVGLEAGEPAMALAASARSIVRQLPFVQMEADADMRATIKALADVLQHEFNRRYEPPYYADKD